MYVRKVGDARFLLQIPLHELSSLLHEWIDISFSPRFFWGVE